MRPPPVLIPVGPTNTWQQGTWEWGVDSEQADSGAGMFVASSLGEGPFRGTSQPSLREGPTSHRPGSHRTTCHGAPTEKASWSQVNWGSASVSSIDLATSPFCSEAAGRVPSPRGSRCIVRGRAGLRFLWLCLLPSTSGQLGPDPDRPFCLPRLLSPPPHGLP